MLIVTVLEIFSVDVISNLRIKQNYSGVWREKFGELTNRGSGGDKSSARAPEYDVIRNMMIILLKYL
jgi:hypothetical protein